MGTIKRLLGLEGEYVCDICGMKFTSRRAFTLHKANHNTGNVNKVDKPVGSAEQ